MSNVVVTEIRRGFYLDSVALMRLSREIAALDGVSEAALMMGSPSNLEIMRNAGLVDDTCDARPNDLVVGLKAADAASAEAARVAAVAGLDLPRAAASSGEVWRPRGVEAAVRALPSANLALVSVPGEFAAAEARKALRRGLNVLMFSDNVSLEDELSLKQEARDLGLLMMGPDCGTAILNGTPLAFANIVEKGSVGIIGASGTGIQEVSCLISQAGFGISHAIGVGGRDLKQDIGGLTTLMAMDLLEADAATKSIVLISKPPHPDVAQKIVQRIAKSSKPYIVCFIGAGALQLPGNAKQAHTLHETAEHAIGGKLIGADFDAGAVALRVEKSPNPDGRIEGLFSGGTLSAEAQLVLCAGGRTVVSNAPVPGVLPPDAAGTGADRILDLGADEYTLGRPHPMIDPSVRDEMLREALVDKNVAVILIDLVIGYGAHPDPAGQLLALLAGIKGPRKPIVASVTGTDGDPQSRSRQVAALTDAGIIVGPSNAKACELALALAGKK